MTVICPTVLAGNIHTYKQQMERVASFAHRVQIDLMDGRFAPHKSVDIHEVWWPAGVTADIHLMYKKPAEHIDEIIKLKPNLLIVHAEAEGDFFELLDKLKQEPIKIGVALLEQTEVAQIEPILNDIDHVLIFSGDLGNFGGQANIGLIEKVQAIKSRNLGIEVGWDGGVNEQNVAGLAQAGVDVLNVGGFIQRSDNPASAYARLKAIVEEVGHD